MTRIDTDLTRARDMIAEALPDNKKCVWTYDAADDIWDTGCGGLYNITEGAPDDNRMDYCPYCGKAIEEAKDDA